MLLHISTDGQVTALDTHDEAIDLREIGRYDGAPFRVSHVEPDGNGDWTADLTPVGGPVLGPYPKRREAIAAEIGWLEGRLEQGERLEPLS